MVSTRAPNRRLIFRWPTAASQAADAIPVNAFRGDSFDNADLTLLKFRRTDPNIDFDWGLGSPDPRIEPDTFSVRWTGNWDFGIAGTYCFTMTADDGMRVWVDNSIVLDAWILQPATTYVADLGLAAGRTLLRAGEIGRAAWRGKR